MSILSPECAGLADFRASYVVGALTPVIVAAIFFETYIGSIFASKFIFISKSDFSVRMDGDRTFNCFFSLIYTFYVAVCKGSIDVFLCSSHPNQKRTLSRAPYVYCDSDDWNSMVVLGVFALAVFCILTGAVFCYQLWIAPTVFHNISWRRRWKFLVVKYRPDVWWWGSMWLLKGLLMNLVLLSNSSFGQLFGLFFVMCGYLITVVAFYPWRHISANMLERQTCVCIIIVAFLALCNDTYEFEAPEAETWCLVISFSPFVVFLGLVLGLSIKSSGAVQEITKSRYELLSVHLLKTFGPMSQLPMQDVALLLDRITSADRRVLVKAADIILSEHYGQQPRKFRSRQRLILSQRTLKKSGSCVAEPGTPPTNTNEVSRDVRTEECKALHLDAAVPLSPTWDSLLLVTGMELKRSMTAEEMSNTATLFSESDAFSNAASAHAKEAQKEDSEDIPSENISQLKSTIRDKEALLDNSKRKLSEFVANLEAKEKAFSQKDVILDERDSQVRFLQDQVNNLKSGLSLLNQQVEGTMQSQKNLALQTMNAQLPYLTAGTAVVTTGYAHGHDHTPRAFDVKGAMDAALSAVSPRPLNGRTRDGTSLYHGALTDIQAAIQATTKTVETPQSLKLPDWNQTNRKLPSSVDYPSSLIGTPRQLDLGVKLFP